eukprot:1406407-Prorocentrum_lima.AAC.1
MNAGARKLLCKELHAGSGKWGGSMEGGSVEGTATGGRRQPWQGPGGRESPLHQGKQLSRRQQLQRPCSGSGSAPAY